MSQNIRQYQSAIPVHGTVIVSYILFEFLPKMSLQLPIMISPSRLGNVAANELILIQKFVSTLIFVFAAIAGLVLDSPTYKIQIFYQNGNL